MKQLLLTIAFFAITILSYAQCENKESVPDEYTRGRYKVAEMTYGNPYTMFNKRRSDWSLENDLNNIRQNIFNGEPLDSDYYLNDYARIYAVILANAKGAEPTKCRSCRWFYYHGSNRDRTIVQYTHS